MGLGKASDRAEWVSDGVERADRAGRILGGAGRLSYGAGMSSEEAGRASQGAIFALMRALREGNRETKKKPNKWMFSCGSSRGHCPKTMTR